MRKDITIPKGTEITAYTNGDILLDPKKFVTQTGMSAEPSAAIVQPAADAPATQNGKGLDAALSTVDIKSTPNGAEITVARSLWGSTIVAATAITHASNGQCVHVPLDKPRSLVTNAVRRGPSSAVSAVNSSPSPLPAFACRTTASALICPS